MTATINELFPNEGEALLALKAKLFRGVSDPSRLAILEALRAGPLCVSDLAERAELSQSNASNHLACLLDCGLVRRERRGRYVDYMLSDDRVEQLLQLAEELVHGVARGVATCKRS